MGPISDEHEQRERHRSKLRKREYLLLPQRVVLRLTAPPRTATAAAFFPPCEGSGSSFTNTLKQHGSLRSPHAGWVLGGHRLTGHETAWLALLCRRL